MEDPGVFGFFREAVYGEVIFYGGGGGWVDGVPKDFGTGGSWCHFE